MNRANARRRLALAWWLQLALMLAPLGLVEVLAGDNPPREPLLMPLFIAGLLSMFVSLPLFHAYKRALIATEKARDSDDEPLSWRALGLRRRHALLGASLPAWCAAAGLLAGQEAIPLLLLTLSSLVLFYLYRLPRQL
ncbi:MFS transporter [Pseudomonas kuykendallii]|uniref:MFS transporter n=1 Tax=Pseudomonas kuykendallii TaxID=1007099 RepID=A0A2W5D536_9PSED|nr:MFS transporter [Pseudomonas kuykendallii]PZP24884.1 MAG: MFS transporter [Pseudomonas kuykendallii]